MVQKDYDNGWDDCRELVIEYLKEHLPDDHKSGKLIKSLEDHIDEVVTNS
jgi:hypothetical protein